MMKDKIITCALRRTILWFDTIHTIHHPDGMVSVTRVALGISGQM